MTREEFLDCLAMAKQEDCRFKRPAPTDEEWLTIEFVYTFHPAIFDNIGKMQTAKLYLYGGMSCIKAMEPIATRMKNLEDAAAKAKAQYETLQAAADELREQSTR